MSMIIIKKLGIYLKICLFELLFNDLTYAFELGRINKLQHFIIQGRI